MDEDAAWSGPVFTGLSPIELQDVTALAGSLQVPSGSTIFAEGDAPDAMYVISDGSVRIFRGKSLFARDLAILGPGDIFGEMALLLEEPRTAGAMAETSCRLMRIDRVGFLELLSAQDRVASKLLFNLARLACARLRDLDAGITPGMS